MAFHLLILCGLVGLATSLGLIPLIRKASLAWGWTRAPRDAHHIHKIPVPRHGGLALAAGFVAVTLVAVILAPLPAGQAREMLVLVFSSLAMFGLGFADDLKPLGAKKKLAGQILIAAGVCACGITVEKFKIPFAGVNLDLGVFGYVATVIWLVALTNLINLVDGVDGLAGGICLMLMGLLAYVGHSHCNLTLIAAGMAGSLLGFLYFNFPPARIYMGDGGAYFLGFLIGISTLISSQKGTVMAALLAPLFVLALPILDTSLAILRRGLHGLPIFRPDRRHLHHRFLEAGVSQRKLVLGVYAFTAIFLIMGFAAYWSKTMWVPNLLGMAALFILLLAGRLNFTREWFAVGRVLGNSLETRQEIQYALSLTHWLTLEAGRCDRLESVWEGFVFTARKLGFSLVRVKLEDSQRSWDAGPLPDGWKRFETEVLNSELGRLELGAVLEREPGEAEGGTKLVALPLGDYPSMGDRRTFDLIADLLAEGWIKAARRWTQTHDLPLSFEAGKEENVVPLDAARIRLAGGPR